MAEITRKNLVFNIWTPEGRGTPRYVVWVDSEQLGVVVFRGAWARYAFECNGGHAFRPEYLREIADFVEELNRG